jgi:hypothetical protein
MLGGVGVDSLAVPAVSAAAAQPDVITRYESQIRELNHMVRHYESQQQQGDDMRGPHSQSASPRDKRGVASVAEFGLRERVAQLEADLAAARVGHAAAGVTQAQVGAAARALQAWRSARLHPGALRRPAAQPQAPTASPTHLPFPPSPHTASRARCITRRSKKGPTQIPPNNYPPPRYRWTLFARSWRAPRPAPASWRQISWGWMCWHAGGAWTPPSVAAGQLLQGRSAFQRGPCGSRSALTVLVKPTCSCL